MLPKESYNGYIDGIPDSVWRLPCDWKVSNNERKCALRGDSTLCACDIENLSENKQKEFKCKNCINFKEHYINQTKILENSGISNPANEFTNTPGKVRIGIIIPVTIPYFARDML